MGKMISTESPNVHRLTALSPDAPDDVDFFVEKNRPREAQ